MMDLRAGTKCLTLNYSVSVRLVTYSQKDDSCPNPEHRLSEALAENAYHEVTKPNRDRRSDCL